jgi:hypothetical protein
MLMSRLKPMGFTSTSMPAPILPAIETSLCLWPGPACGMLASAHRMMVVPRMIVPARFRKICARVSKPMATFFSDGH